ncbi:SCY1-like protein 2 [Cephus cinctus]|uniref:SCY1-like protein 2 n=1 Tax=Cephus cinctus TaxID=211228 RepID=A0AAJ7BYR2_CEPCN|nr:SCY1-like protein 2 [Cephus cinctus]XP_015597586.1 SCY1-like protein 2 [Cephus cinctus]XP_024941888.1 SCY1-like protein 2 [Cephus cinctus]XP_024941889.1 SCY1-like protein 2 [Cephus cinctus]
MDVLNKLRNTVSNTISNTVNSTAYGLSQLSSVLPGNPVTREFEATAHIASAGPGLLWKVYSGYKKSTRQEAAIFVFEKRLLDRWSGKAEREAVLESLRRGVTQLTKLRHPQILIVQHPLEESRDSLAFATEPVFASLANALGRSENVPQPPPAALRDYKLLDVEIRYGLLQLGEGLAFLHGDVKLLHRNVCPESIVINGHGAWKIFGFDFCALNQSPNDKQPSWSYIDYDPTIPAIAQPQLDFQAPECIIAGSNGPPSDIFSLGMLVYTLYSPGHKPLNESHGDPSKCRRFLGDIKTSLPTAKLSPIPEALRDTVKLMLTNNPELRPDAHQFIKIEYFTDIGVKTLNYLDKLFQWDNLQKSQFYKGLPQVIKQLPHRVALHRVLPALYKEFVNAPMVPFVLPSVLQVAETGTIEEFREHILPNLKPVLALGEPPQISLVLMQRVDLLLKLCPADVIKSDVVPMLTRALDSNWEQLQELCLAALPSIATLIEGPSMKNAILPRIKKLCIGGKGSTSSLGVRVNCLLCLAKMLENLDRWLVLDQILPFLQEIPHSGEPAVLMAIIGIYKLVLTHSKLGMSKEIMATRVLPFLLPLCVEQSLSPTQFETLATLVGDMITKVTSEHREALKQLDAVRRDAQQFDQALSQAANPAVVNELNDAFAGIELAPPPTSSSKPLNGGQSLTLQDKQRLAQQQEASQRLQSQASLAPKKVSPPAKPQPKDLTNTLLQNNLNQLNLSPKTPPQQPNYSVLQSANWSQNTPTQTQWGGLAITAGPQSAQSPTGAWNANGMSSPGWSTGGTLGPNQTISNWNQIRPQNVPNQSWNMSNNSMGSEWRSDSNTLGMSQPLMGQSNNTQQVNLSTQDIMDLLS